MPKKDQQGYYGFDPSGLERAATAAKYLDQSQNAKEAFQLALKKEDTKQLEITENTKKLEIQKSQIQEEERRKTAQYEAEMSKRRAEYQIQLELQRDQEKLRQKEQMREMRRQRDEESIAKQEAMRRQTVEYEFEHNRQLKEYEYQLKAAVRQQRMEEELKASEQISGQNRGFIKDLFLEAERERRESQRQNLVTAFNLVGGGAQQAIMNPKFLIRASYLLLIGFGAFHLTRLSLAMITSFVLARFGKPTLVRETSKLHTKNYFIIPFLYARKFLHQKMKRTEKDLLEGVILEKNLEDQLREISYAVLNRKKHFAPTKNLMFYGPPGTGKTLFAKKLAMKSGLEYAIMVGSDIAPLGPLAVRELNKLFDWAEQQKGGIILFIDEADAFLRNRKQSEMSEYMRHTINSFLYRTGSPSDNVILVMATNCPDQLDEAVHDRIDEIVGFGLPSINERKTMLFHYLVKYCQPPVTNYEKAKFYYDHPRAVYTGKKLIRMEGINSEVVQEIAEQTEGFSGREIQKMVVAWHDAAFTLPEPILTPDLMRKILHKFHLQHKLKKTWTKEEGQIFEKMLFLNEDQVGTAKEEVKDEAMLKEQEEITQAIYQERLSIKEMRQHQEHK